MNKSIKPIESVTISGDYTSNPILKQRFEPKSLQINVDDGGTCTVQILQSIDGVNYVNVTNATEAGVTNKSVIIDLTVGNPRMYKVSLTAVSGTPHVEIFEN